LNDQSPWGWAVAETERQVSFVVLVAAAWGFTIPSGLD
jgi:hypothetical protein